MMDDRSADPYIDELIAGYTNAEVSELEQYLLEIVTYGVNEG